MVTTPQSSNGLHGLTPFAEAAESHIALNGASGGASGIDSQQYEQFDLDASDPTASENLGLPQSSAPSPSLSPWQWFRDLPIGRKQLLALVLCQLVPIVGLGVGSTWVLTQSLRSQTKEQARSEVAVTEINYNIKINQMGLGSRGEVNNLALINASRSSRRGEVISPEVQTQLREILKDEIQSRKIEYATLLGTDGKILANANQSRTGEIFNPGNLVTQVMQDREGRQVKANLLVAWSELAKEAPPLPPEAYNKDALVRFVITPVRDPNSNDVIGLLLFGDVANGKKPVVENTLKVFGGGYSAIYMRQSNGRYSLATALDQGLSGDLNQAQANAELSDPGILNLAAQSLNGKAVTQRIKVNGQTYTVAAKAIPNQIVENADAAIPKYEGSPPAILVRGTPETTLNQLLRNSLLQEIVVISLGIGLLALWNRLFSKSVLRPLQELEGTTQKFTEGDRHLRAVVESRDEVGQLSATFNRLAENIVASETALAAEAQRQESLGHEQRRQKEAIQNQLVDLLMSVEGATRGDLTVRADVTTGEIGTVGDFFNAIVESLRQIVTQVKQSVNQVNSSLGDNEQTLRQLAAAALQQADETTRTLDSVEAMNHSIQRVASNARNAAEVSRSAAQTTAQSEVAMDLTVESITHLRQTIGDTAKKVKRLGESSQQISKVVSLINQIALQTNLLAINAGIEAARAGEEGKGFAVVAEEVGELAARSAAATREIEQIVETIQQETSEVVEAMEQGTSQVVDGTRLVEQAKLSLSQILEVSRQVDYLVQSISEATVAQVQTSETISSLMQDVSSLSGQTSDSANQASQSLRQTVEIAKDLQTSVGTFKVE
jgi:twitching motility protein PilJ